MNHFKHHPRHPSAGPCRLLGLLALAALVAAGATLLSACNRSEPPPAAEDEGALKLERPYANQKLGPAGTAQYRFHAKQRGAYLIMVYNNPTPLDITLRHPKKVCYLLGNGSCELVTGPDESYAFEVTSNGDQEANFSVMVTHSEGTGRYEGEVHTPLTLEDGIEHTGTVGVRESSYYSFTAAQAGPHTIALTGTQSDLLWRLFDAVDFDVILQECDQHFGAADEVCQTFPLHADKRYYVKVEEKSGVPGPYRLTIHGP